MGSIRRIVLPNQSVYLQGLNECWNPESVYQSRAPLIYLAAPMGHPDPPVRQERFERVNRYCGYLIGQHELVFSPLSLGASLDEDAIRNSAWYALGLQMLARCDELRILALKGWEDSAGVTLETRYARQLHILVSVADPSTYEVKLLHGN